MSTLNRDTTVIGLASIGAALYAVDEPVEPGSTADAERYAWSSIFITCWRSQPEEQRERLRTKLERPAEAFDRALVDAEERDKQRLIDEARVASRQAASGAPPCAPSILRLTPLLTGQSTVPLPEPNK